MTIDWSKAPEGATHYCTSSLDGTHWRDYSSEIGLYWHVGQWKSHLATSEEILSRGSSFVPRPAQWNGEGLPPAGTVCELVCDGVNQGVVTVMYISEQFAVCKNHKHQHEQGAKTRRYKFRPIRTPEQIAAEEREKGILLMAHDCGHWWKSEKDTSCLPPIFSAMWEAGYRKQVAK